MNVPGPSLRGLWALLWRSVFLIPFALALFAVVCCAGIGFLLLPVATGMFIWHSEWWQAAVCVALWFPSWVVIRRFWRWERSDESDHRGIV